MVFPLGGWTDVGSTDRKVNLSTSPKIAHTGPPTPSPPQLFHAENGIVAGAKAYRALSSILAEILFATLTTTSSRNMSTSSSIAELLGSPQVVVGFGATTLVLLATTFFYLKNNEGSSDGGAASTSSALEKVEELDSEVSGVAAFFYI